MTNEVLISPFDQDFITVAGTSPVIIVTTSARFNGILENTTDALNNEVFFTRWFDKSGTYKVRYIHGRSLDGGIIDFAIDSPAGNNLFDGINHQAAADFNNIVETTIVIARGYHNISILAQADGGTSDFRYLLQALQFDLIDEHPVLGESRPAVENTGSMVLLGKHEAAVAESTFTFDFSPIDFDDDSELILQIDGEVDVTLSLEMRINGDATPNYFDDGYRINAGAQTFIDRNAVTAFELGSTLTLDGNRSFASITHLLLSKAGSTDRPKCWTTLHGGGIEVKRHLLAINIASFTSITILTSTGNLKAETRMSLYKVKRT